MKQIKKVALFLAIVSGIIVICVPFKTLTYEQTDVVTFGRPEIVEPLTIRHDPSQLKNEIQAYLELKGSPLAPHTDLLLEQEHWKLIIAISAIESSYCTRQLGNNCWRIAEASGGYKEYASLDEAIIDANGLITRWQARGRWLTVEDMNCHYVVPCNANWVSVVNAVLEKMELYEQRNR